MPWLPDFSNAVELARRQTRAAGQADAVGHYFTALNRGHTRALEDVWPGEVVVYDPHAGEIRGHKQLRQFVRQSRTFLAERHARIETVASTVDGDRAVVELLAHLAQDGREVAWPVAVVAESSDDRSVEMSLSWRRRGRQYRYWPAPSSVRTPSMKPRPVGCSPPPMTLPDRSAAAKSGFLPRKPVRSCERGSS